MRVQLAALPSQSATSRQEGRRMSNTASSQSQAGVLPFQPASTCVLFAAGSACPALAYIGSTGATSLSMPRPQLAYSSCSAAGAQLKAPKGAANDARNWSRRCPGVDGRSFKARAAHSEPCRPGAEADAVARVELGRALVAIGVGIHRVGCGRYCRLAVDSAGPGKVVGVVVEGVLHPRAQGAESEVVREGAGDGATFGA
jgi:hypothetical protein